VPTSEYWFKSWCVASRWQREVDAALAPWRLAHTRYLLLHFADRLERQTGDAISQRQLAAATLLGESAVSTAVSALCEQGLLDRDIQGVSPFANRITITDEGRAHLARTRPVVEAVAARFFAEFGHEVPARRSQIPSVGGCSTRTLPVSRLLTKT
jgi:DNA-binding MarR family transcriptional regulator